MRNLVWFSCGAASAVAAKLAVEKYPDCELLYCDTLAYEHPDNLRFMRDVEAWTGKSVKILRSKKYEDIYDVFHSTGWLIGPRGARCTQELKQKVRRDYQREGDVHIFGMTSDESDRIMNFEDRHPELDFDWILENTTKSDCYRIIQEAGIELPEMYKLGYNNNNCIGCVKGGLGYWNKIRVDFPEIFEKMGRTERKLGIAINKDRRGGVIKRVFLDKLDPNVGRDVPMPDIECGALCIGADSRVEAQEQLDMKINTSGVS